MKKFGPGNISGPYLEKLAEKYKSDKVLKHHLAQWDRDKEAHRKHMEKVNALKGKGPLFEKIMKAGETHYKTLCFACHGSEGQGTPMAGTDITLAPPLKASPRVLGNKDKLIKIALHGLMGPVDGKTYPGAMESLATHNDKYLSQVLTYIRNSWGNTAEMINEKEVKTTRKRNNKRKTPWTLEELKKK